MKIEEDWEFNVLGVYNYNRPDTKQHYFDFIRQHHDKIDGDIIEAGVFRGRSILATGLLLKELGSEKKVYGYDSFSGFPPIYHHNDDLVTFSELLDQGRISQEHFDKVEKLQRIREIQQNVTFSSANISQSGDFSDTPIELLRKKITVLGLDNIVIVQGPFAETMTSKARTPPQKAMAAILDCDLYRSYQTALPFIWQRLKSGGYIFLDEYYSIKFPGARIATDEFLAAKLESPQQHQPKPGEFERWFVKKSG